jgi:hypothetical protein
VNDGENPWVKDPENPHNAIWRADCPERILFGLASDEGARRAASQPNNGVENDN